MFVETTRLLLLISFLHLVKTSENLNENEGLSLSSFRFATSRVAPNVLFFFYSNYSVLCRLDTCRSNVRSAHFGSIETTIFSHENFLFDLEFRREFFRQRRKRSARCPAQIVRSGEICRRSNRAVLDGLLLGQIEFRLVVVDSFSSGQLRFSRTVKFDRSVSPRHRSV